MAILIINGGPGMSSEDFMPLAKELSENNRTIFLYQIAGEMTMHAFFLNKGNLENTEDKKQKLIQPIVQNGVSTDGISSVAVKKVAGA